MNLLHQIASGAKDLMLQQALGYILNAKQITKPETKTTVRLDAKNHLLIVNLHLKGEASPSDITISYQITEENEIEILGIQSKKHWIPNTVALILAKRRIKFHPKEFLIAFPNKAVPLTSEMILSFLR